MFHFILWPNNILLYRYTISCICLYFDRYLGIFIWGLLNNAAVVHSCAYFLSGYIFSVLLAMYLGVELLGRMVTWCLNFRETAKLFHSNCTILHSQQQYVKVPVSPHPHQYLLTEVCVCVCVCVCVFIVAFLVGKR